MWTIIIFGSLGLAFSGWMIIREIQRKEFDITSIGLMIFITLFCSIVGMLVSRCIPSKTIYQLKSTNDIVFTQDSAISVGLVNGEQSYALLCNGGFLGPQMIILPYGQTTVKGITSKPVLNVYEKILDPEAFLNNFSTSYEKNDRYEILTLKGTILDISTIEVSNNKNK